MSGSENKLFVAEFQQLLCRLLKEYEQCDKMCLSQYRVTAAQGYTLLALPQKDTLTMNELSEAMGLANSTMTRMVDQLVKIGLARRRHDDADGRVIRVELTDDGRKMRLGLTDAQEQFHTTVLEQVPAEEHETILRALRRVSESLQALSANCCSGRSA